MKKNYLIIGGLAIVGLTLFGLSFLIDSLGVGALRVWAILATLALFPTAIVSWRLGGLYASGVLEGLGIGVDRVSAAATKLKVREPKAGPTNIAVLPALPPVQHRQLTDGESEVIDL